MKKIQFLQVIHYQAGKARLITAAVVVTKLDFREWCPKMKTIFYRFVHFIRTLILGKPKRYMGMDFGYGVDHNAVTLIAKHKDGGITVEWSKVDPTLDELRDGCFGKISAQEWERLTQYDWAAHRFIK